MSSPEMQPSSPDLEPIKRLSKDLKNAAKLLSREEARYLVDSYYQLQEVRKATNNQVRGMEKKTPGQEGQPLEPCDVLKWFENNSEGLENQIKRALEAFALNHREGRWAFSITGIGPVLSAALLAHIDIDESPTSGHIWRFGGVDPTLVWEPKTKRPFNASLKVVFWKIGQSFLKNSGRDDCEYGKLLLERWAFEKANNVAGKLSGQATAKLEKFKIGKATEAYGWYSGQYSLAVAKRFVERDIDFFEKKIAIDPKTGKEKIVSGPRQIPKQSEMQNWSELPPDKQERLQKGMTLAGYEIGSYPIDEPGTPMLPPAHVLQRACRYATKLFLAHYQHVAWETKHGVPPVKPYVLDHIPGHIHFIKPPKWPCE